MPKRIVLVATMTVAIVFAFALPASAHVTVDPPSAPQGATVKLSFLAPNEEPTTKMTELAVSFPTPPQTPIPTVTVEAKPGWTVTVTNLKLAKPIVTDDGSITDIVSQIDWKAKTAADGIGANQFGEFTIDADGLPDNEDQVVFKAIQTYANGDVVRWIDPVTANGPEAEHPTPILVLTKPAGEATETPTTSASASDNTAATTSTSTKDNSARALAIIAIALGAVALVLATGAFMRKRRAS
jgi:periplasmic copper chaperone A